ncbi:MAG: HipA domain-containing protein [Burkholderiales bacterium]|nr:HipA domain-containing protein [Burkholderiales bacterium]MDE1926119.1 HipA domain-containing protein [Burkholderiales bacterium]MDE2158292.1 HipA domain-containing protein [Burkholderiales bacterium]
MAPRPGHLDVYYGSELVGAIHDASPLAFEYALSWLGRSERMAVAAIALQPGRNDSAAVQAFFENLLPEGELRHYLAEQRKASTLFSLLLEVAGDTAGGFVIVAGGQRPEPPSYEATTWESLAAALGKQSAAAVDLRVGGARVALAGAQDKAGIALFDDGLPRLPRATSPSTHILKPDIKRLAKVWQSAANETLVMRAAAHCGLPTAEVFYEPHTESCLVRRFDRLARPDGSLARLVQYDMCQLAGTVSERKYEKAGGPGLAACAELIRRYSTQPAVDLRHFVRWVLFNLYAGNNDSHAKNLSIYSLPGRGVRLTPFYDLMCTRIYPGLAQEFAFAIGGEYRPASLNASHLLALASELGMRPQFIAQQAAEMARILPGAIEQAVNEIKPALSHSAKVLADRLRQFVHSTTKKLAARLEG